jgi:hypothetical protein
VHTGSKEDEKQDDWQRVAVADSERHRHHARMQDEPA